MGILIDNTMNKEMPFYDIQKDVDEWTSKFVPQYWDPLAILARLMEETGEVAREINHLFGPKEQEGNLGDEIVDIIFTLCCLANSQKISLDRAWNDMMVKYKVRDKDRYRLRKGS